MPNTTSKATRAPEWVKGNGDTGQVYQSRKRMRAAAAVGLTAAVLALTGTSPGLANGSSKELPQVSIVWVGDIALSRSYGLPADGGRSLFAGVKKDLQADITVGNLEGTLGTGGSPKCGVGAKNCFSFQAPPSYAQVFAHAGFDLMNVANNHAFDYGPTGQAQTLSALRGAGVRYTGRPSEITVLRRNGIRVAFVGFAPYRWAADLRDLGQVRALVGRARHHADVVVVLMHAGAEGANQVHTPMGHEIAFGEDRGDTRAFAHAAVDAGAALVLGSGPHVVRGMERYHHGLIAYSLGNFAGSHTLGLSGVLADSAMLQLTLQRDGRFLGGQWTSVLVHPPGVPRLDPGRHSLLIMRAVSKQDFGRRRLKVTPSGRLLVGRP